MNAEKKENKYGFSQETIAKYEKWLTEKDKVYWGYIPEGHENYYCGYDSLEKMLEDRNFNMLYRNHKFIEVVNYQRHVPYLPDIEDDLSCQFSDHGAVCEDEYALENLTSKQKEEFKSRLETAMIMLLIEYGAMPEAGNNNFSVVGNIVWNESDQKWQFTPKKNEDVCPNCEQKIELITCFQCEKTCCQDCSENSSEGIICGHCVNNCKDLMEP